MQYIKKHVMQMLIVGALFSGVTVQATEVMGIPRPTCPTCPCEERERIESATIERIIKSLKDKEEKELKEKKEKGAENLSKSIPVNETSQHWLIYLLNGGNSSI
jgi:hypothetical protein